MVGIKLDEVFSAAAESPDALSAFLKDRKSEITEELAAEARGVTTEAFAREDGNLFLLASLSASVMYLHLGDRHNSLQEHINFNGGVYMFSDSTDAYVSVRSAMRLAVEKAHEIEATDLEFRARVLAAEAGFHALEGVEDSKEWRVGVLNDIAAACQALPDPHEDLWYQRLVYILAVAASEATFAILIDDDQRVTESLRALASWVEARVPVDFEYKLDPQASAEIAAALTKLTDGFG